MLELYELYLYVTESNVKPSTIEEFDNEEWGGEVRSRLPFLTKHEVDITLFANITPVLIDLTVDLGIVYDHYS